MPAGSSPINRHGRTAIPTAAATTTAAGKDDLQAPRLSSSSHHYLYHNPFLLFAVCGVAVGVTHGRFSPSFSPAGSFLYSGAITLRPSIPPQAFLCSPFTHHGSTSGCGTGVCPPVAVGQQRLHHHTTPLLLTAPLFSATNPTFSRWALQEDDHHNGHYDHYDHPLLRRAESLWGSCRPSPYTAALNNAGATDADRSSARRGLRMSDNSRADTSGTSSAAADGKDPHSGSSAGAEGTGDFGAKGGGAAGGDGGGSGGGEFPVVTLDADATQKFAEIEVEWGDGGGSQPTVLIRGLEAAAYHIEAAEPTMERLRQAGAKARITGGGRIKHSSKRRSIFVYGYSMQFGPANLPRVADLCRKQYPADYEVTWTEGGY